MDKNNKFVGVLLTGGLSRRYGSPKAFAKLNDNYFYEYAYEALKEVCDSVIIVARKEFVDWFPKKYRVIVDVEDFSGCGPLAGIFSTMAAEKGDNYVVLPCDMPLITSDIMRRLIDYHEKDVTVVKSEGYLQPLVSVWSSEMKRVIETALQEKRFKMTDVLDRAEMEKVDGKLLAGSTKAFLNVNTPEEDKEMRKWKRS